MIIYKYTFETGAALQEFEMPKDAITLSVQVQEGKLVLWSSILSLESVKTRYFEVLITGVEYKSQPRFYVGTVQFGDIVLHIFELPFKPV